MNQTFFLGWRLLIRDIQVSMVKQRGRKVGKKQILMLLTWTEITSLIHTLVTC